MPSVNSSDSPYAITRTLSELERDLRADHKRARERMNERVDDLEESYKRSLARRDEDTERAVNDIKETASEDLKVERASSKAQLDQLKKETYDKLGRYNGVDGQVIRDQHDALRKENDRFLANQKATLDKAERRVEQRLEEQQRRHEEELAKVNEKTREAAEKTYAETARSKKAEFEDYKETAEKRYERLVKETQQNLELERKRGAQAIEETQTDHQRRTEKTAKQMDIRADKLQEQNQRSIEEATQALHSSRIDENTELRRQIKDLTLEMERGAKDRAQGTQDAVSRYENDWRDREGRLIGQYEAQAGKLEQKQKELELHYQTRNAETLTERDQKFAAILSQNSQEARENRKELINQFEYGLNQKDLQLKHEQEKSERKLDQAMDRAGESRVRALEAQATAYQGTIGRNQQSHEDKVGLLQNELNKLTKDPKYQAEHISPAAEAEVLKAANKDFKKTFSVEKDRNQHALDSMQKNYSHRMTELTQEKDAAQADLLRRHLASQDIDRRYTTHQLQQAHEDKAEALRNKENESARQTEQLNRSYSSMMERQRRSYDEVIQTLKSESSYRLAAQRQESEFALRNAHREFSTLQNQMIREHEKKMSEFKAQYDSQIEDLKTQSRFTAHDLERKGKLALDEQARTYEQRLTQLEQQHKERERSMTENFQEQIEKVKRSNALNYSKKG